MRLLAKFDWILLLSALLLVMLGITMIASTALGESKNYDLAIRQSVFAVIGLGVFVLSARIETDLLRPLSWVFYILSVLFLIVVFVYGLELRGSVRWIDIGAFRFQPSEMVKLSVVLLMANLMISLDMRRIKNILFTLVLALLPAGLVLLQPDLGSASVIVMIWLGMILATNFPRKYLIGGVIVLLLAVPLAFSFLQPYQRGRLLSFLNPGADPLGAGYNVIQSSIAVGSGGIFGRGFGRGTQSHLNFLPEHHTDFIFATLAEELGLIGAFLLISLLGVLCWRLLTHLPRVSRFGGYILVGMFIYIAFQAAVNIGMNLGLAPVTGIPLPFVSYGGSSLITLLAGLGIVEGIIARLTREEHVDD